MRRLGNDISRLLCEAPDGPGNVLVRVEPGPYRRFGRRIDCQLAVLEDRWSRPVAGHPERMETVAADSQTK